MVAIPGKNRSAGVAALIVVTCIGLAAAACSSSPSSSTSSTPSGSSSPSSAKHSGTVNVAYASSIQYLNEKIAGPAFTKDEGYTYSGRGGASGELESNIASGEISPNVFESVGGDNITPLEPKFTTWYIQYASTQIVVAYNPNSKYASDFKAYASGSKPLSGLFTLMQTSGFKLGRTDPNIDPQGRAFIYMLELARTHYNLPADTVSKILGTSDLGTANSSQIFAESSLDATLQSGQLDAASAYLNQAIQLHLSYITLPAVINLGTPADKDLYKKASVTITSKGKKETKHGSPLVIDITTIGSPTAAGTAFVAYTLSATGRAQYTQGGYTLITPKIFGDASAVPASVTSELGS
jgi:molybdate/tungstate transport system substrate-binding protein